MNLFSEFARWAPNRVFFGALLGGIAGGCYSVLIPIVSDVVSTADGVDVELDKFHIDWLATDISRPRLALAFALLCAAIFCCRLASRTILSNVSIDLAASLRTSLSNKIAIAATPALEQIGQPRLQAALTEDITRMIVGAQLLPLSLMNFVTIVGCLGFLAYINTAIFRLVFAAVCIGVLTYQIPMFFGSKMFEKARLAFDDLQVALDGVIRGAKELRSDQRKRHAFFEDILKERQATLKLRDKAAHNIYIAGEAYGDLLGFLVIGLVAFVVSNVYSVSSTDLLGAVLALLYISGPITFLVGSLPPLAKARASVRNVHRLLGDILAESPLFSGAPSFGTWNSVALQGAVYSHASSASREGYTVGPIDAEFRRGEVTFIIGANGSGKSTLAKILALHYPSSHSAVVVDGVLLDSERLESFRQCISAVFSDYHLFDRLLGTDDAAKERASKYLDEFGLQGKLEIRDGVFSSVKLSDGQRRRLALLVALVDDKDMYILDEWAADQDPEYKRLFYQRVLPELRARGKAVVVVSHDDRFFSIADKTLVMEGGRLVGQNQAPAVESESSRLVSAAASPAVLNAKAGN